MPTIGVLALQGGFREHGAHLRECGIDPVYIRDPDELARCAGLIIPGGESSCLRRLMAANHIDRQIGQTLRLGNMRRRHTRRRASRRRTTMPRHYRCMHRTKRLRIPTR